MWQQRILAKEDLLGMDRAAMASKAAHASAEFECARANEALAHHLADTALDETRNNIERTVAFGKRKLGITNI